MNNALSWGRLDNVYRNATWRDGEDADLHIADQDLAELLKLLETDDTANRDANLNAVDPALITIGNTILARIGAPSLRLGVLVDDWESFLSAPRSKISEPRNYYIKSLGVSSTDPRPSTHVRSYRRALKLVRLLEKCAVVLDTDSQKLVFFKDGRLEIPVEYSEADLPIFDNDQIYSLENLMAQTVHAEHRQEILADAVVSLARSQPIKTRFTHIARNLDEIYTQVENGYRLFASSFSYSKIKSEVEAAQSEYIGKIHKTFSDIQGQLLGIPVATVVVATQFKDTASCNSAAWANVAIAAGSWVFALLIIASCVNQFFTLSSIHSDVDRQMKALTNDFAEIKQQFMSGFSVINRRICWHRIALSGIIFITLIGAGFSTYVFKNVSTVSVSTCLRGGERSEALAIEDEIYPVYRY